MVRSLARTFSRMVQSMVTLWRTVSTSSQAMALQGLVAEDLDRAVVGLQSVVEGQLFFAEAELLAAGVGLSDLLGQADQFLDHLGGLDGPALVAENGLLQHLCERSGLHYVAAAPAVHLALQQPSQCLDGQVALEQAPHFGQELLRQHRDVGLVQAGRCEDVEHALRGDGPGDDLADGVVEVLFEAGLAGGGLRQRRGHRLEEGHVVPDGHSGRIGHGQRERLGQLAHRGCAPILAVFLGQDVLERRGQQA